jgi:hypothetical protein
MTADRDQQSKALALRVALSPSFQAFFNSKAAPEVWEKLVATWDEETMHTMTLILDEEDSMRKDLSMTTARKTKVNQTRFLQQIEQMRVKAHAPNQTDNA